MVRVLAVHLVAVLTTSECSSSYVVDHPNWTDFVRNMADPYREVGYETELEDAMNALLSFGCEALRWSNSFCVRERCGVDLLRSGAVSTKL